MSSTDSLPRISRIRHRDRPRTSEGQAALRHDGSEPDVSSRDRVVERDTRELLRDDECPLVDDLVSAVIGSGRFPKGVSGNPGGRPKGLSRATRELVGDDGMPIVEVVVAARAGPDAANAGQARSLQAVGRPRLGQGSGVRPAGRRPRSIWKRLRRLRRSSGGEFFSSLLTETDRAASADCQGLVRWWGRRYGRPPWLAAPASTPTGTPRAPTGRDARGALSSGQDADSERACGGVGALIRGGATDGRAAEPEQTS